MGDQLGYLYTNSKHIKNRRVNVYVCVCVCVLGGYAQASTPVCTSIQRCTNTRVRRPGNRIAEKALSLSMASDLVGQGQERRVLVKVQQLRSETNFRAIWVVRKKLPIFDRIDFLL